MKKAWITYGIVAVILLALIIWIRSVVKKRQGQTEQLNEDAQWLITEIDKAAGE